MRMLALSAVLAVAAACSESASRPLTAPAGGPSLVQNAVDTVGLPDLIVDSKATQQN